MIKIERSIKQLFILPSSLIASVRQGEFDYSIVLSGLMEQHVSSGIVFHNPTPG
jgi:hypothetical protein